MNFGDYHDLYLTTDVLILADIFEALCDTCTSNYGLDPARSFTSPGLAWQAALKMSDVQLDLSLTLRCISSSNGEYVVEWQLERTVIQKLIIISTWTVTIHVKKRNLLSI